MINIHLPFPSLVTNTHLRPDQTRPTTLFYPHSNKHLLRSLALALLRKALGNTDSS